MPRVSSTATMAAEIATQLVMWDHPHPLRSSTVTAARSQNPAPATTGLVWIHFPRAVVFAEAGWPHGIRWPTHRALSRTSPSAAAASPTGR
jgi:hypothetical protein